VSRRVFELTEFLVDVLDLPRTTSAPVKVAAALVVLGASRAGCGGRIERLLGAMSQVTNVEQDHKPSAAGSAAPSQPSSPHLRRHGRRQMRRPVGVRRRPGSEPGCGCLMNIAGALAAAVPARGACTSRVPVGAHRWPPALSLATGRERTRDAPSAPTSPAPCTAAAEAARGLPRRRVPRVAARCREAIRQSALARLPELLERLDASCRRQRHRGALGRRRSEEATASCSES